MDGNLINTSADSIIILYRSNAADDWALIPFTKAGTSSGVIRIDTLLFGEYALAIGDKNQIGIINHEHEKITFEINPNPSKGIIQITSNNPNISLLSIYRYFRKGCPNN